MQSVKSGDRMTNLYWKRDSGRSLAQRAKPGSAAARDKFVGRCQWDGGAFLMA